MLPLDRVTPAVWSWLKRLEPMGMGNAEPVFLAQNVLLTAPPRYMKEKHVRLQVTHGPRGGNRGALGWSWAERVQSMATTNGNGVKPASLTKAIDSNRRELRERALEIGERVYAEKPKEFTRQIRRLWETW